MIYIYIYCVPPKPQDGFRKVKHVGPQNSDKQVWPQTENPLQISFNTLKLTLQKLHYFCKTIEVHQGKQGVLFLNSSSFKSAL